MEKYKRKFVEGAGENIDDYKKIMDMFFKKFKLPFKSSNFKMNGDNLVMGIPSKFFGIFDLMFKEVDLEVKEYSANTDEFYKLRVSYNYKHPSGSNGYTIGYVILVKSGDVGGSQLKLGNVYFQDSVGDSTEIGTF